MEGGDKVEGWEEPPREGELRGRREGQVPIIPSRLSKMALWAFLLAILPTILGLCGILAFLFFKMFFSG